MLPSSQTLVPVESVPVSMLESSTIYQKNDDVTATSGTELTENPSTKGFYLNYGLLFLFEVVALPAMSSSTFLIID